jgi:hypothetical protein
MVLDWLFRAKLIASIAKVEVDEGQHDSEGLK